MILVARIVAVCPFMTYCRHCSSSIRRFSSSTVCFDTTPVAEMMIGTIWILFTFYCANIASFMKKYVGSMKLSPLLGNWDSEKFRDFVVHSYYVWGDLTIFARTGEPRLFTGQSDSSLSPHYRNRRDFPNFWRSSNSVRVKNFTRTRETESSLPRSRT